MTFDRESYGTKRIRVKCSRGDVEALCLETVTQYVSKTQDDRNAFIRLEKNDSQDAIAGVSVKGEFFSEDSTATVTVSIGNYTSENLNVPSANGHFALTLPESAAAQGTSVVTATLATRQGLQKDSARISFPPRIRIVSASEEKCEIIFSLDGTQGNEVQVEELVDGIPATRATFSKDVSNAAFPMLPGTHHYKIFATDKNGSRSETAKTFTCKE